MARRVTPAARPATSTHRPVRRLDELPQPLLARLLAADSGDGRTARLPRKVDWTELRGDADSHVVSVLLGQRLRELGLEGKVSTSVADAMVADRRHARLQHLLQQRDAETITAALTAAGVRHAFLKGFAYRQLVYRPAWVRLSGDVDILVDPSNAEVTRHVLRDLGFTQASCAADYQHYRPATPQEIAHVEARHYELAQFVKNYRLDNAPEWLLRRPFVQRVPFAYEYVDGQPTLHSCVDVHWALHFWFASASPLDDLDPAASGLPLLTTEWNLLFSSFKLYFESFDRPRHGFAQLVDLAALLKRPLDWDRFAQLVRANDLGAAAFYTLRAAERVSKSRAVPAELYEEWSRVPREPRSGPDAGDFAPFLVGRRVAGDFLTSSGR
jgi:hypothetical protein